MIRKYYRDGSNDLAEGVTFATAIVGDDGEFLAGNDQGFMRKEITAREYQKGMSGVKDANSIRGMAGGVLTKKGVKAFEKKMASLAEKQNKQLLAHDICLSADKMDDLDACVQQVSSGIYSKILKQIEMGILTRQSADYEIRKENVAIQEKVKSMLDGNL